MSIGASVVVIAKNEAINIRRCLESVRDFDDIVVVDDFSEDDTASIARSLGARVMAHRFESFAAQRNWALENADLRNDWVLMLDADESLTPAVCAELASSLARVPSDVAAFLMCRRNWFLGRFLRFADGFPVWIMRLVRRGQARFVDSGHGEVPAPPVDGVLLRIRVPFRHYPFSHGMSHWLERHNLYSTREAEWELQGGRKIPWRNLFRGQRPIRRRALRNLARSVPCRPLLRFGYHYFWKCGFLDGRAGLAYSLLMSAYEGMIVLKRREGRLSPQIEAPVER